MDTTKRTPPTPTPERAKTDEDEHADEETRDGDVDSEKTEDEQHDEQEEMVALFVEGSLLVPPTPSPAATVAWFENALKMVQEERQSRDKQCEKLKAQLMEIEMRRKENLTRKNEALKNEVRQKKAAAEARCRKKLRVIGDIIELSCATRTAPPE